MFYALKSKQIIDYWRPIIKSFDLKTFVLDGGCGQKIFRRDNDRLPSLFILIFITKKKKSCQLTRERFR